MSSWADADGRLGPGAEWYASAGWKVLPCYGLEDDGSCQCGQPHKEPKDTGKHPHGRLVHHGHEDATADVATVRSWWQQQPRANVGVACKSNGFVVVDVDPRNGGDTSLERLDIELGEDWLVDTVEARTGLYTVGMGTARGRHLFYRVGEGESFHQSLKELPGIDFKHKGYVLVNPSRHFSGLIYEWKPGHAPWEREVADCPQSLLELIRKRTPVAAGAASFGSVEWGGEKIDIDALVEEGIFEGERATKLFRIACAYANLYPVEREDGRASVHRIVHLINQQVCHPPMDWGTGGPDDFAPQCENAIQWVRDNPKSRLYAEAISPELMSWATGQGGDEPAVPAAPEGGGNEGMAGPGGPPDRDALSTEDGGMPGRRSLSDIGNGRRLIDYAGGVLRYTIGLGWYVWKGEYWIPDVDEGETQEMAKALPKWIGGEIVGLDEGAVEGLLKWANRASSLPVRAAAVKDASRDPRIRVPVKQWDSYSHLLGVKNGVIDLTTGALLPNNPELYITKQTQVAYTPGLRNQRWELFLDEVTRGDVELQRWMQKAAGYTLTGDRDLEVLFMVYGPAGSGKSTFLEVLGKMLGDYWVQLEANILTDAGPGRSSDEYHIAQLMGKRMAAISELPPTGRTKDDALKRLTGDTVITARHPAGRPFQFESQAKVWIGTNHRPTVDQQAMWRRYRVIHFDRVPERPDPALKPYLLHPEKALPAALSWAVDGAVALLGSSDIDKLGWCRHVREATEEYKRSEDRIGLFLDEETREVEGAETEILHIYAVYRDWALTRGEPVWQLKNFAAKLDEKNESVSGMGNRARVKNRVLNPRVVTEQSEVPWASLVERRRT